MKTGTLAVLAVLVAVISLPFGAALAQVQGQERGAPAAPAQAPLEITVELLDAFVGAAVLVIEIRESWQSKIEAAENEAAAKEMAETARTEMRQAVEDAPGISTQDYVIIARAAQENPELARVIETRVRQRQQ